MRTILTILFVLSSASAKAVTNTVACTYAAVSAALTSVNENDRIIVLPGTCTITASITSSHLVSFWFSGSGTNQTKFICGSGVDAPFIFDSNASNVMKISDFSFDGLVNNSSVDIYPGPITHVWNVSMTNCVRRSITMLYGLVDHCTFRMPSGNNGNPINFGGYGAGFGYTAWTNTANPIGTTNVACVEDCYFQADVGGSGNGFFDGYYGAQYVFRHNYCTGYAPSGSHGYDSGDSSARTWEIYWNTFTNPPGGADLAMQFRGGTGVIFSNTISGYNEAFRLDYYRSSLYNHGYIIDQGQAGKIMVVNFTNGVISPDGGAHYFTYFNGQPANGSSFEVGFTTYHFVSSYSDGGVNFYGGGNVVIGPTVAATITNLFQCMNLGPGKGTVYAASARLGYAFTATNYDANCIYLVNRLDGTNVYGYPANEQEGVLVSYPLTSTNFVNHQVVWPAYQWGNTLNGSPVTFDLGDNDANSGYYITNLLKAGRDYSNAVPSSAVYTPLVYPHPFQATEGGGLPAYNLTVTGGSGTGSYTNTQSVAIVATGQANSYFTNWSESVLGMTANTNNASTTVMMPNQNATVTANYVSTNAPAATVSGGKVGFRIMGQ